MGSDNGSIDVAPVNGQSRRNAPTTQVNPLARITAELSPRLTVRPPVLADAERVTDITNRQALQFTGVTDTTVAQTLTWWQEPTRDLTRDSLVVTTVDGEIVACIDYSEYDPFDENEFDMAVDPAWQDQGIEDALLLWVEERAREALPKAPAEAVVTLETRIWAQNARDHERLLRRGYAAVRYWDRMEIALDAAPEQMTPPAGISIRTARDDEISIVHAAWEDAQRDEFGFVSLSEEQFHYYFAIREPNFDPSLWFLAIDDETSEVVGYVLGRLERPGDSGCGHVRYVGVRRGWRRRGIAATLLERSFGDFYRRGQQRVSLAVDSASPTGAHRLYERVGMQPTQRSVAMMMSLRSMSTSCQSAEDGLH